MKILAIETSCDDTGIAILEALPNQYFSVLSNIVSSQIKVHQKYGGVYPAMAKREHQRNLVPTLIKALKEARTLKQKVVKNFTPAKNPDILKILEREPELYKKLIPFLEKYEKPDVNLIAVTNGPGLEPCLWTGVNFAKALSYFWNIPVVAVNHVESHILVNLLENKNVNFPAIALVVSGGHTQIILVNGIGKYKILGETRDDAAGECFDKCAKILGLEYPGGPIIAKLAEGIKINRLLPRPMIGTKDYDFSFSGLKTAVLYAWKKTPASAKNGSGVAKMAAEVQQAIIDVLIKKTIKAAKDYKAKTIILGGGVSANKKLRNAFFTAVKNAHLANSDKAAIKLLVPEPKLSTDNAVMTAITGFYHKKNTVVWKKIQANGNLRISK